MRRTIASSCGRRLSEDVVKASEESTGIGKERCGLREDFRGDRRIIGVRGLVPGSAIAKPRCGVVDESTDGSGSQHVVVLHQIDGIAVDCFQSAAHEAHRKLMAVLEALD